MISNIHSASHAEAAEHKRAIEFLLELVDKFTYLEANYAVLSKFCNELVQREGDVEINEIIVSEAIQSLGEKLSDYKDTLYAIEDHLVLMKSD